MIADCTQRLPGGDKPILFTIDNAAGLLQGQPTHKAIPYSGFTKACSLIGTGFCGVLVDSSNKIIADFNC